MALNLSTNIRTTLSENCWINIIQVYMYQNIDLCFLWSQLFPEDVWTNIFNPYTCHFCWGDYVCADKFFSVGTIFDISICSNISEVICRVWILLAPTNNWMQNKYMLRTSQRFPLFWVKLRCRSFLLSVVTLNYKIISPTRHCILNLFS